MKSVGGRKGGVLGRPEKVALEHIHLSAADRPVNIPAAAFERSPCGASSASRFAQIGA